jgi:hypothetical protein
MELSYMGFPDLAKDDRVRVAEAEGRKASPNDLESMSSVANISKMSDNSQDAITQFCESLHIDDDLASFVVHSCTLSNKQNHQSTLVNITSFIR